jgi:hypothetical protein
VENDLTHPSPLLQWTCGYSEHNLDNDSANDNLDGRHG